MIEGFTRIELEVLGSGEGFQLGRQVNCVENMVKVRGKGGFVKVQVDIKV